MGSSFQKQKEIEIEAGTEIILKVGAMNACRSKIDVEDAWERRKPRN